MLSQPHSPTPLQSRRKHSSARQPVTRKAPQMDAAMNDFRT
uniref:Uncharacterized protein n=1 Tax=Parascaris equorum TaxID=6256 RepID=A0A914RY64_PAREQ